MSSSSQSTTDEDEDVESIPRSQSHSWSRGGDRNRSRNRTQGDGPDHRDMLIIALLEDHFRTLAVQRLSRNRRESVDRESPDVDVLARYSLFEASQTLASTGILGDAEAASDDHREARQQYLVGVDSLARGNRAFDQVLQSFQPQPTRDLPLNPRPLPPLRTPSGFQEMGLLGKGGFGRVFQYLNRLDEKMYAVKKIPLSPKLNQRFCLNGFEELRQILREVRALSELNHPNVVRYHNAWLEEPTFVELLNDLKIDNKAHGRKLIADRSFIQGSFSQESYTQGSFITQGESEAQQQEQGFVFEYDSDEPLADDHDILANQPWSERSRLTDGETDSQQMSDSSIFTDGNFSNRALTRHRRAEDSISMDPTTRFLCIQMALYPMTLAQYLTRAPKNSDEDRGSTTAMRHCYHLVPSLLLLLGILKGLQYIHSKGLIHRDIKPGNIFLSEPVSDAEDGYCDVGNCPSCDGKRTSRWINPRIGDFGLVTQLAYDVVLPEIEMEKPAGTAYYRPPPNGGGIDEKIDIFALGVILVEMLCPTTTTMERIDMLKGLQHGDVPLSLTEAVGTEGYAQDVIDAVERLAHGMVTPDPRRRWSCEQIQVEVEDVLTDCEV